MDFIDSLNNLANTRPGGFRPSVTELWERIRSIQQRAPASVRWKSDPWMASRSVAFLKQMGLKKPWLTSQQDFIADALLRNQTAYGILCSEIILMDFMGGFIKDCWDGAGICMNLDERAAMLSSGFAPFGPNEIGGGFIIQFDIANITDQLRGFIQQRSA